MVSGLATGRNCTSFTSLLAPDTASLTQQGAHLEGGDDGFGPDRDKGHCSVSTRPAAHQRLQRGRPYADADAIRAGPCRR